MHPSCRIDNRRPVRYPSRAAIVAGPSDRAYHRVAQVASVSSAAADRAAIDVVSSAEDTAGDAICDVADAGDGVMPSARRHPRDRTSVHRCVYDGEADADSPASRRDTPIQRRRHSPSRLASATRAGLD